MLRVPSPVINVLRYAAGFAALAIAASGCALPSRSSAKASAAPSNDASPALDGVVRRLRARIAVTPGARVAISVRDLGSDRVLAIDGDSIYHAASTMKVPVLFALFGEFEAGRLKHDGRMLLRNEFRSIVDGSPYALTPNDDSDSSLYAMVGSQVTLTELATRMITRSSNLATNALITLLDPERITAETRAWGTTRMLVRRGVEDNVAFRAGLNNTATANDLVALFVALAKGQVADSASTREMLAILEAQSFNDEIPAGLPPGTRVAHKTGWITATQHDAGLVYPPGRMPYAIAILTRGITDQKVANALMADCSRIVWEWMNATR